MKPLRMLSSAVLVCASVASAWPWQGLFADGVNEVRSLLMPHAVRRDAQVQTLGSTDAATPNPSAKETTEKSTPTTGTSSSGKSSAAATSDGSAAPTTTTSGSSGKTSSEAKKSSKTTSTSSTTFDPRLPAGGVSMITPNVLSSTSYYKIGDYVTFAWNYTSLSVTPSAIDVLASCSVNDATYTLAQNQSIQGPTGAVTWDTGAYEKTATVLLLTGTYTLIIHDAAKDVSATALAGYLGTYDQFTFGMYTPQAYTPLNDGYVCATCNGAISVVERQTMGFLFAMAGIAVLSFTWFAGGAGVLL